MQVSYPTIQEQQAKLLPEQIALDNARAAFAASPCREKRDALFAAARELLKMGIRLHESYTEAVEFARQRFVQER